MAAPPPEAFASAAVELARSAKHPLPLATSSRGGRALFAPEGIAPFPQQGNVQRYSAPGNWRGRFTELLGDGAPASSTSRGWLCEFRVCWLCQRLYERRRGFVAARQSCRLRPDAASAIRHVRARSRRSAARSVSPQFQDVPGPGHVPPWLCEVYLPHSDSSTDEDVQIPCARAQLTTPLLP
jgi:hypothetical protein